MRFVSPLALTLPGSDYEGDMTSFSIVVLTSMTPLCEEKSILSVSKCSGWCRDRCCVALRLRNSGVRGIAKGNRGWARLALSSPDQSDCTSRKSIIEKMTRDQFNSITCIAVSEAVPSEQQFPGANPFSATEGNRHICLLGQL